MHAQAAAGTDRGDVAVLDCSGGRLEAVARFRADAGPVSALAARVSPRQAADVAVAEAPRGLDGGGVLPAPVGLSWRDGGRGATWSGAGWLKEPGCRQPWIVGIICVMYHG